MDSGLSCCTKSGSWLRPVAIEIAVRSWTNNACTVYSFMDVSAASMIARVARRQARRTTAATDVAIHALAARSRVRRTAIDAAQTAKGTTAVTALWRTDTA